MTRTITTRVLGAVVGTALVSALPMSPALAAPTELLFNVFIPAQAPLFKNGLEPWARAVEAASNGTLEITIPTSSLAPPARQFDIVQDGVADLSVAPLAFKDKQLTLYRIAAIPLIADTAEQGSVAFWDTHEKYFAEKDQWEDFIPLTLFTLGAPAILSSAGAIDSRADLDGFKMLAVGQEKIALWQNLGAAPVGGSGQKPFESVSSGVADGATNPLGTAVIQGLLEVTDHVTLVPGGIGGRAAFTVFISRDRFEGLPEEAQQALIDSSGAELARTLGAISDTLDATGLKKFEDKGIAIGTASPEFVEEIRAAGAFIEEEWLGLAEEAGVDGPAALENLRSATAGQ